jgi:hypothetical protein
VPGLEVHEGADEVEAVSCSDGNHELAESRVVLDQTAQYALSRSGPFVGNIAYSGKSFHPATL